MRPLLNPKWVFILNSLPVAVLLLLLGGEFSVIKSLLPPASRVAWQVVPALLGGLAVLLAAGAAWYQWRRQELPLWYAGLLLALSVGFMGYYFSTAGELMFPREIPRWMIGSETALFAFTFLMPSVVHGLLMLVLHSLPVGRPASVLVSFGLAGAALLGGFVVMAGLSSLASGANNNVLEGLFFGLLLGAAPLGFLFFLTRGLYLIVSRRGELWAEYQLLLKVLVAGILPLAGLALNKSMGNIFGDFDSPWTYGLLLLTAVLLCLPRPVGRWGRLALLAGRSLTLGYTLYFFLVFLPWLPLSVLAILLIGTGFLMLAPTLLFVVHFAQLDDDLAALRGQFRPLVLRGVLVAGLLTLPLGLTASFWHERRTLYAALDYVYAPTDAPRPAHLDHAALAHTLDVVQEHKDNPMDWTSHGQPYLSLYFNWLVLDHLTLADAKLTHLRRIFDPIHVSPADASSAEIREASWRREGEANALPAPRLTGLHHRSHYDARQQAWTSWVDLELTGPDTVGWEPAEYATELTLPPGCWIQDYYLDIDGRREHGLLAEKKAAAWVYAQIRTTRRDPGIVHYLTGNRVGLRVYPLNQRQRRRTGLCFVHKEPVTLQFDGQAVQLGDSATAPEPAAPLPSADGAVVYLSPAAKQQLPRVQRRPYYHFLLDASATPDTTQRQGLYARLVREQLTQQPLPGRPRFTLVDAYDQPLPAGTDWQRALRQHKPAGGFYASGAIGRTLRQQRQAPTPEYPVLVLVSENPAVTVLDVDFAELAAAYPESPVFYTLGPDGLVAHSLLRDAAQPWPAAPASAAPAPGTPAPVRAWPTAAQARAYLPDDQQPSIVLDQPAVSFATTPDSTQRWTAGLLLEGYRQQLALHPAQAEASRLPAIRTSFRTGILMPLTAYLSLENDAQKAALRRKQQQTLNANAALDAGEDTPPTAVPIDGGAALLLAAAGALGLRELRRRKAGPSSSATA